MRNTVISELFGGIPSGYNPPVSRNAYCPGDPAPLLSEMSDTVDEGPLWEYEKLDWCLRCAEGSIRVFGRDVEVY